MHMLCHPCDQGMNLATSFETRVANRFSCLSNRVRPADIVLFPVTSEPFGSGAFDTGASFRYTLISRRKRKGVRMREFGETLISLK